MKLVLDTCVLFPHPLRHILLGVAQRGAFAPLWSARILEEWARATRKLGPGGEVAARAAAARMLERFPRAMVQGWEPLVPRLHLPDPDDVHVLACAIAGHADAIVTFNAGDFPRHVLAAEGLARRDPDGLLWEIWSHDSALVEAATDDAMAATQTTTQTRRAFLKRAGLPRLGKAMLAGDLA